MKLSRKKIQRMIEGTGGTGGGGGSDESDFEAWASGQFLSLKNGGTVFGDTEFKGALTLNQENVATQNWVDDNYVSIYFFRNLFRAYNSAGTSEITPNHTDLASVIENIKAMHGFWTNDYVTALSDARYKDIKEHICLDVDAIAKASLIRFSWKDGDGDTLRVGGIAQEWKEILPEAVVGEDEGVLRLNYALIGMVAAVSLARKVQEQQREIDDMKSRLERLESMIVLKK